MDALAALVFGYLYDRIGFRTLIGAAVLSAGFAPLVFLGGFLPALFGVILWGIGMGAQESIMRAAIAHMTPPHRRGTAYGVFNTGYGLCWFLGSVLMGFLYEISITGLVAFSVAVQLASVPLFMYVHRNGLQLYHR
jgi:MFS family permease